MRSIVLFLFLIAVGVCTAHPARKPNVIVFLVDDLGYSDVGCYGSDYYETPYIDGLAASGMRFTQAYASSTLCSPTRASLLTGKNPARLHITHAIPIQGYKRIDEGRGTPLKDADYVMNLPLEEVTVAEALKAGGYATASIGKWHVCHDTAYYPEFQGFDVNIGGNHHGHTGSHFFPYEARWRMAPGYPWEEWRTLPDGKADEYLTDRLTAEAVNFIDQNRDAPFFLYLSHYAVHTPIQAKKQVQARYERKMPDSVKGHIKPAYAAMIESVDASMGTVLRKLDELGLTDNTIVIFTSDNGGFGKQTSNYPFRGNKGNFYEGGIRVPLIIRWPGMTDGPLVSETPVITTDLYPTILEMTGLPLAPEQHIDGMSLKAELAGSGRLPGRALYWHFPNYVGPGHPDGARPLSVIRHGDWKLIESLEDGSVELYQLTADISESHNVAAAHGKLVDSLRGMLGAWRTEAGVQLPEVNPAYAGRKNVLFLLVDDLRPNLHCYGDAVAITPNMDRLAARGVLFRRAYCQQAVCSPSRTSMLTGLRPDETGVHDLRTHFRENGPDIVTLPQAFKEQGYFTASVGKVFHNSKRTLDPVSWTREISPFSGNTYVLPQNRMGGGGKKDATERADVPDTAYADGRIADDAIGLLDQAAALEKPFFLAVGFKKPHAPFCAPERYWKMYDRSAFAVTSRSRPEASPALAFHGWEELRGYADVPDTGNLTGEQECGLIHGYYACISYVDAQIGKVMDRLEALGLADKTIVVLWGDHGYHLGEQDLWCKSTNFELDTRVPLIVAAPGMHGNGHTTNAIVESVDIFPTLTALCGIRAPEPLSGISLRPLLDNPSATWSFSAFSQFTRPYGAVHDSGRASYMGYSVRTDGWRCTYWYDVTADTLAERELYRISDEGVETENIASNANVRQTEAVLAKLIDDYRLGRYAKPALTQ